MDSGGDILTTTQVAKLLRCSRQHVAHLCDSGELPSTRTGTHRRIRRGDLRRYLRPPLRREDERSLWINLALAAKLIQDPDGVIEQAKTRLQRLRASHNDGSADVWLDRWETALNDGPHAVLDIMTSRSEEAATMRSTSPMSGLGLLTDDERTRILTSFSAHWRSVHRIVA